MGIFRQSTEYVGFVSRDRVADFQQTPLVQPMRDVLGSLTLTDLRSGRSVRTDGYPIIPTVDDGSTGDLVLVQSATGQGMVAHDLDSRRPAWTLGGADAGGALVLDGRVVRVEPDALRAVDARTGATVWSTPAAGSRVYGLHTDGDVVVRAERDGQGGTVLVARSLDDGRVRWTSPVADDLEHLQAVDGRLVGLTAGGVVAFGSG